VRLHGVCTRAVSYWSGRAIRPPSGVTLRFSGNRWLTHVGARFSSDGLHSAVRPFNVDGWMEVESASSSSP